jgi:hypothetical protein
MTAGENVPRVEIDNSVINSPCLHGLGRFSDRARNPIPALLLLDLKLPGKSSFQFLGWLRTRPEG